MSSLYNWVFWPFIQSVFCWVESYHLCLLLLYFSFSFGFMFLKMRKVSEYLLLVWSCILCWCLNNRALGRRVQLSVVFLSILKTWFSSHSCWYVGSWAVFELFFVPDAFLFHCGVFTYGLVYAVSSWAFECLLNHSIPIILNKNAQHVWVSFILCLLYYCLWHFY